MKVIIFFKSNAFSLSMSLEKMTTRKIIEKKKKGEKIVTRLRKSLMRVKST